MTPRGIPAILRRLAGACALGGVAALSASAQSIAINLGTANRVVVAPTAEITVPVIVNLSAAGSATIASLQAGLTWNAALLTFDSLRVAPGVSWVLIANTANAATGSVTFNAFDAVALSTTSTLANAFFTGAGAQGGTRVSLVPTAAGSETGQNVLPFLRPRALDVCLATPGLVGDVNGDGSVNIIDAQQISRFSVGLSVANLTLLLQRGDVNLSGTVDIVDGQQIARFSVGLPAASAINTLSTFIPAATAVSLSPGSAQALPTGGSIQVSATPSAGATNLTGCAPVTWQSSNTGVAVVNASGFVSAVGGGSATITAASGSGAAQLGFSVSGSSTAPVASVTVALSSSTVAVGSTAQATATLRDANNNLITGRTVTWSSSNNSCATVNSTTGVVSGVSACSASIIASVEGVSGQANLTVMVASVASVGVALSPVSVAIGQAAQATATVRDAGGNVLTGRTVTWSSSNTARATVNSSGVVTGVSAGTVNIVATSDGVTGQASLSVTLVPVATVAVSLGSSTISATTPIQTTTQATATLRDAAGNILTGRTVTWSSSNTARATVNSSTGLVTAVSPGSADIIATSEGVTGLRTITLVTPPVAAVSVSIGVPAILPGSTAPASAVVVDERTNVLTGRSVSFSSSNTSVATVGSSTGIVTGVAIGTANIVATSEGQTGQTTVTVAQTASNEPSGMTVHTERPFNCQKPTECEGDWNFSGKFSVIQDASAPRSPSNVGQILFPAGFGGGSASGQTYPTTRFNSKTAYMSTWVKFSSNFQNHTSGTNKLIHFNISGINRVFLQARFPGLEPAFGLQQLAAPYTNSTGQTGTSLNLLPNLGTSVRLARDVWYHLELIMVANTPGAPDGSLTMFVNGVKVMEYFGITFAPSGGAGQWEGMNISPTWGGTGDVVASDMFVWFDHFYGSKK